MYKYFLKRAIDFFLSCMALVVLSPLFLILIVVGAVAMKGNPFFIQKRPGKNEKIFSLIKFRTMSNAKDENGQLLSDGIRLNKYGNFLRSTSLDELPELVNILLGQLSIVGPRPQLVRDMLFMTEEQRRRHSVTPGLTGLAQVNGRNNITWEQKFKYDLEYIDKGITFFGDLKIIFKTAKEIFKTENVSREGEATDIDLGDWLMMQGKVDEDTYNKKQEEARKLLGVK